MATDHTTRRDDLVAVTHKSFGKDPVHINPDHPALTDEDHPLNKGLKVVAEKAEADAE